MLHSMSNFIYIVYVISLCHLRNILLFFKWSEVVLVEFIFSENGQHLGGCAFRMLFLLENLCSSGTVCRGYWGMLGILRSILFSVFFFFNLLILYNEFAVILNLSILFAVDWSKYNTYMSDRELSVIIIYSFLIRFFFLSQT